MNGIILLCGDYICEEAVCSVTFEKQAVTVLTAYRPIKDAFC